MQPAVHAAGMVQKIKAVYKPVVPVVVADMARKSTEYFSWTDANCNNMSYL